MGRLRGSSSLGPFYSLRKKLIFLTCLATLPALLFTFFAARNERTSLILRSEKEANHYAQIIGREHLRQIEGAQKLVKWLANYIAVYDLQRKSIDGNFLKILLAGHPQLANIGILSPKGEVLMSAYSLSSYVSWSDRPLFKAALMNNDVVTGVYNVSPIFKNPTLNHAFAIRNKKGEVQLVIFSGLDLSWINEIGGKIEFLKDYLFFVVDQSNKIISSNTDDSFFHNQNLLHEDIVLDRFKSDQFYFIKAPLEGATYFNIAVRIPIKHVLNQANSVFIRTLLGLLILTIFIIVSVFIATELGVLRTLSRFTIVVQKMSRGDFSVRMELPKVQNEFFSLAQTFNIMADSLDLRQRQNELAHSQLRALTQRLQNARETEAARIARDLHDEIGQMLTGLKINISRLYARFIKLLRNENNFVSEFQNDIEQIHRHINTSIDFVRKVSSELRPSVLDKLGLFAAFQWQVNEIKSKVDFNINLQASEAQYKIDEQTSVVLFRIFQEALTNVIRHAQASNVDVQLVLNENEVILSISDDGIGFSSQHINELESLGLTGMRERALLANGSFSIDSNTGQGVRIKVVIPISNKGESSNGYTSGR